MQRAPALLFLAYDLIEFGFVLGGAAGTRFSCNHARGFGLAHALAGVGFDGFGGGKNSWLAFRHGKDEYKEEALLKRSKKFRFAAGAEMEEMEERDFFNETTEQRTHTLSCPKCGQAGEYKVTWVVRRKRAQLPRGADERDRAKFAKAQSYMVRRDEKLSCANVRCRKPFEISSLQSVAFLAD